METDDYIKIVIAMISLAALLISVITFFSNKNLADSNFYLSRYSSVESKLDDWQDAYRFYSIDLQEAEKNDVTSQMISYLVLYIVSMHAKCRHNKVSVYQEIKGNSFRENFFRNQDVMRTWEYAKNFFGDDVVGGINDFYSESSKKSR